MLGNEQTSEQQVYFYPNKLAYAKQPNNDTWVAWGYKGFNYARSCKRIWEISKLAMPSETVKATGKLVLVPSARFLSNKTGYKSIENTAYYGLEAFSFLSSPVTYVAYNGSVYLAQLGVKKAIEKAEIENPEIQAALNVTATELTQQGVGMVQCTNGFCTVESKVKKLTAPFIDPIDNVSTRAINALLKKSGIDTTKPLRGKLEPAKEEEKKDETQKEEDNELTITIPMEKITDEIKDQVIKIIKEENLNISVKDDAAITFKQKPDGKIEITIPTRITHEDVHTFSANITLTGDLIIENGKITFQNGDINGTVTSDVKIKKMSILRALGFGCTAKGKAEDTLNEELNKNKGKIFNGINSGLDNQGFENIISDQVKKAGLAEEAITKIEFESISTSKSNVSINLNLGVALSTNKYDALIPALEGQQFTITSGYSVKFEHIDNIYFKDNAIHIEGSISGATSGNIHCQFTPSYDQTTGKLTCNNPAVSLNSGSTTTDWLAKCAFWSYAKCTTLDLPLQDIVNQTVVNEITSAISQQGLSPDSNGINIKIHEIEFSEAGFYTTVSLQDAPASTFSPTP